MEFFNSLNSNILELLDISFLGLNLNQYLIFFILILIAILFNTFIANFIVGKLKVFVKKTGNKIDDNLFESLIPPCKLLPIVIVFFILSASFDKNSNLGFYFIKINNSLATIFVFWFMHRLLIPFSTLFNKLEKSLSKGVVAWIINSIKYLIIFLGTAALLETWGIKVGPVIAGLGLLGVAVALGAQDLFKNLISGIMILMEKRFQIGDVINVPGHTEGTVEQIGFRSTLIKTFDSTPISIPNYIFADAPILNYSNRRFRRINWTIGVEYNSKLTQIKKFTDEVNSHINISNDFIVNDNFKSFIRLDKFNDSSIDILVYCFTSTNDWDEYLQIKEKLAIFIKEKIEEIGLNFAFPSQSIYLENFEIDKINKNKNI